MIQCFKKAIVMLLFVALIVSFPITSNAKEVSVGKVKSVKSKADYRYYKGLVSAKDMRFKNIKYKYGIKVTWKKVKGASGYEIYTYGVATKKWTKKKDTKKTKYTFNHLAEKTKVKLKIRAYKKVNGKKVYGAWSSAKTIKSPKLLMKIKKNAQHDAKFYERYAAEQAFVIQNQYRKAKGIPELKWSEDIYQVAMIRAKAISKDFSHNGFMSTTNKYFKDKYGILETELRVDNSTEYNDLGIETYLFINGENIADGYRTAKDVCEGWKDSKGHYLNLLGDSYKSGAIACYYDGKMLNWVSLFGEIGDLDHLVQEMRTK